MRCEEAQELITALVDNELPEAERSSLENHLRDCPNCQFIYGQEQALKREIRMIAASVQVPADLRERILSDRRVFAERDNFGGGWKTLLRPLKPGPRVALAGAVLLLLLVPVLYVMWPTEKPIALAALQSHESIVAGASPLRRLGGAQEVQEFLFRSVGGTFAPMEYDFAVVGLKAAGGLVQDVGGRKILVTVYECKGLLVSCYTFLGVEKDAPVRADVFFDPGNGKTFYTFSRGRMNGVMQRVGERICILVAEMPLEEILALARSKAKSGYVQ